jgi:aldose 1-epimerase
VSRDDRGWVLRHGPHHASVTARGGAIRTYAVDGSKVIDGFEVDELPPAFNGAVLAPWPNRVRDGAWQWQGTELQLPITERSTQTALHGLVLWSEWHPVTATRNSVRLVNRVLPQPGYPFALLIEVTWSLNDDGLRCDLAVTNEGHVPAPFGIGTHPFFGIEGVGVDEMTLTVPAETWTPTDARLLPRPVLPTRGSKLDFTVARPLDGVALDTAFSNVTRSSDGRSTVILACRDARTEIWADESFGWWQIYTSDMLDEASGRHRRSVAIEAMTCGPDAFNSGIDLIVCEPGAAWRGSWGARRVPVAGAP